MGGKIQTSNAMKTLALKQHGHSVKIINKDPHSKALKSVRLPPILTFIDYNTVSWGKGKFSFLAKIQSFPNLFEENMNEIPKVWKAGLGSIGLKLLCYEVAIDRRRPNTLKRS